MAADEEAVGLFLKKKIRFFQIQKVIEKVITSHRRRPLAGLDDIFGWQEWAKDKARSIASRLN